METYLGGPESTFRRAQRVSIGVDSWESLPLPEERLLKRIEKNSQKREWPIFGEIVQNEYGAAWIVLFHYTLLDAVRTQEERLIDRLVKTAAEIEGLVVSNTTYPLVYAVDQEIGPI
jgi:hypothetical protein